MINEAKLMAQRCVDHQKMKLRISPQSEKLELFQYDHPLEHEQTAEVKHAPPVTIQTMEVIQTNELF